MQYVVKNIIFINGYKKYYLLIILYTIHKVGQHIFFEKTMKL
jgi:hypothetical protein